MARSGHPDSAGSQFFIMVGASPHLDGDYAINIYKQNRINVRRPAKIIVMATTNVSF